MAETARVTPITESMNQDFAQALKDVEAKSVPASTEQVEEPVSGNEQDDSGTEAQTEEKPVAEQPATKEKPSEEKLASMRAADYTQKTQELARERAQLSDQVAFAEAWMPTAVAYNRATPDVQAQVKALLEGKSATDSKAGATPQGVQSERVQKLLDSFEEGDRGSVKAIFDTMLEEAEARAEKKYGELKARLDETSSQTRQETEIRATRESQEAFSDFDRQCPEWRELSERQLTWFQNEILSDPNIDPVKHFKETFLPELGSRGRKEASQTVKKIIERGGQSVIQPSTQAAEPRAKKPASMNDAFDMICDEMSSK